MTGIAVFFCGPLADEDLRTIILAPEQVQVTPARLADHVLLRDGPGFGAALAPRPGSRVEGSVALLTAAMLQRVSDLATAMGWARAGDLAIDGLTAPALTFAAPDPGTGAPWDAADWLARHAAQERLLTADIVQALGAMTPAALAGRLGPMRVRAASRLRGGNTAPCTLRQGPDAAAVAIEAVRQPYARFFAVEEYDLSVRRFDGGRGVSMTRAVFVTGDAVTVLPYDPVRDRVLLIEQFRAGPMARGDPVPWSLEAIAGRIDPGETAEEAARREAVEEAGLTLGQFWPVANYYPSPGGKTEFLYSFVAEADLPDGTAGIYGLPEEAEDIRGHVISFDRLMELVASGEIGNAPVILTAFWLARERDRLCKQACG